MPIFPKLRPRRISISFRIAIRNSDQLRQLNERLSAVAGSLAKEADGLTTEELIEECAAADIDQIVAREETLQQDLKSLRTQFMQAAQLRTETRNTLNSFGGEARAAEAAALRQTALTEMREAAEDYVRVRVSAVLLQWAIERFRREKQAPMLKRSSAIFAALTGNSFTDLRLEFDEQDNPHLAGVRADGKLVRVDGLSTGTADQLYLALRIASIEEYLDRACPIPFVADDLFINFDNERAASGFQGARRIREENPGSLLYTPRSPCRNRARDARKRSQCRGAAGNKYGLGGLKFLSAPKTDAFASALVREQTICCPPPRQPRRRFKSYEDFIIQYIVIMLWTIRYDASASFLPPARLCDTWPTCPIRWASYAAAADIFEVLEPQNVPDINPKTAVRLEGKAIDQLRFQDQRILSGRKHGCCIEPR